MQRFVLLPALALLIACNGNDPAAEHATTRDIATWDGPLTLIALLEHLAPEHGANMVEWNAEGMHPLPSVITWQNEKALADKEGYSLVGKVSFQLPGNGEMQEAPMEWEIRLAGNQHGYNRILLSHFNSQEAVMNDATLMLGKGDFVLREVQLCTDDLMMGFTKHELTFPKNAPGWFRLEWSSGSEGMARWIEYTFDPAKGKTRDECL